MTTAKDGPGARCRQACRPSKTPESRQNQPRNTGWSTMPGLFWTAVVENMERRFSQRIGKVPVRESLQDDGMDNALRAGLWNAFLLAFVEDWERVQHSVRVVFFKRLCLHFFRSPIDTVNEHRLENDVNRLRELFLDGEWHQVYDLIEYLATEPEDGKGSYDRKHLGSPSGFIRTCNGVLEKEMSAYRIVGAQIMRITSDEERVAIEEAVTDTGIWSTSGAHISKAATYLFDRANPDYPNSVKEAISAVESACCVITRP